ncbi:terminase large subunit [Lysinibacillus sp. NPDC096418]|uniref:terminase large subunit n=1 Tax=Lysinibacillus sp. NPDC096418 TaxID=3364138 RepID=UPI00381CBE32
MINYALEYANKAISDEIVTCHKIKQACRRFIRDLERSQNDDFPYYFDVKRANKAIQFVELMPSTDGTKINALLFQKWIVSELYGWKEKGTGNRRYNRAFISMARKNSKTWLASSVGGLSLIAENKPAESRQILFIANALKQAKLGYTMLKNNLNKIVKESAFLRDQLKIMNQQIQHLPSNSFATALSSDLSSLDGYAGTTIIVDEYALQKNRDVIATLKSGQQQEPNALLAIISTAGVNVNCPMKEDYDFLADVLDGKQEADRYFIAIYELDDAEEATTNEDMWIKANPIFEHEGIKQTMLSAIREDVELGVKQNNLNAVLVKNFNMWLQASEDSYIADEDWKIREAEDVPDIRGRDIYIGIDLSKTNDLTSVSWCIPLIETGQLYCDSHSWVGTKYGLTQKIKRDGINYVALEQEGECSITKLASGIIDYEDIFNWIMQFIQENELNVQAICYDKWNANTLITKLEKEHLPLVEVRQGVFTLNTPTRTFREQLYDGNIIHSKNKLLTYAVNNAILKIDNNGVIINKNRNSERIDPIAALMNAYTQAMFHFEDIEGAKANNEFYVSENFSF